MIKQPMYESALSIFNDNERQFFDFLAKRAGGVSSGGGDAVICSFQGHNPRRATGIPTGNGCGHSKFSDDVKQTIDLAIKEIQLLWDPVFMIRRSSATTCAKTPSAPESSSVQRTSPTTS